MGLWLKACPAYLYWELDSFCKTPFLIKTAMKTDTKLNVVMLMGSLQRPPSAGYWKLEDCVTGSDKVQSHCQLMYTIYLRYVSHVT